MTRLAIALNIIVAGLLYFPVTALSDGLISQLPVDGTWVRYDYESQQTGEMGAVQKKFTGTVTLSSVGRESVDDQPYRWIEFKSQIVVGAEKPDIIELFKVLVPEEELAEGGDPLSHVIRGWYKYGGITIPSGRLLDYAMELPGRVKTPAVHGMSADLSTYLPQPWEDSRELEDAIVESKLGKHSCSGIARSSMRTITQGRDPRTIVRKQEVRMHNDAPFGVVSFREEIEISRDGKFSSRTVRTLKLADKGEDAKSDIPDVN